MLFQPFFMAREALVNGIPLSGLIPFSTFGPPILKLINMTELKPMILARVLTFLANINVYVMTLM